MQAKKKERRTFQEFIEVRDEDIVSVQDLPYGCKPDRGTEELERDLVELWEERGQ